MTTGGEGGGSETTETAHHIYISKNLKNRIEAYLVSNPKSVTKNEEILADSACSSHMTPHANWLLPDSIRNLDIPVEVHLGDDSTIQGTARGSICLFINKEKAEYLDIHDVLLV
ncbi:hypothetical protein DFP72DRAFT_815508, partial [Ephemerocybe angulata]